MQRNEAAVESGERQEGFEMLAVGDLDVAELAATSLRQAVGAEIGTGGVI